MIVTASPKSFVRLFVRSFVRSFNVAAAAARPRPRTPSKIGAASPSFENFWMFLNKKKLGSSRAISFKNRRNRSHSHDFSAVSGCAGCDYSPAWNTRNVLLRTHEMSCLEHMKCFAWNRRDVLLGTHEMTTKRAKYQKSQV